jgi:hypothetical protein
MFPVHVLKSDEDLANLPDTGTYYLITANGIMEHKVQGVVRSITPVDKIPYLLGLDPAAGICGPPIPANIAFTAFSFFRTVWEKYKTESALRLFYSLNERKYRLECPQQEVGYASVQYKRTPAVEGWKFAGTIHSHCDFDAGHSGIDTKDEFNDDGFHATFGQVNRDEFTAVTTIVAGQMRFPQSPVDCIPSLRYARQGTKTQFVFDAASIAGIDPGPEIAAWMPKVEERVFSVGTTPRRRRGRKSDFFGPGFGEFIPLDTTGGSHETG